MTKQGKSTSESFSTWEGESGTWDGVFGNGNGVFGISLVSVCVFNNLWHNLMNCSSTLSQLGSLWKIFRRLETGVKYELCSSSSDNIKKPSRVSNCIYNCLWISFSLNLFITLFLFFLCISLNQFLTLFLRASCAEGAEIPVEPVVVPEFHISF